MNERTNDCYIQIQSVLPSLFYTEYMVHNHFVCVCFAREPVFLTLPQRVPRTPFPPKNPKQPRCVVVVVVVLVVSHEVGVLWHGELHPVSVVLVLRRPKRPVRGCQAAGLLQGACPVAGGVNPPKSKRGAGVFGTFALREVRESGCVLGTEELVAGALSLGLPGGWLHDGARHEAARHGARGGRGAGQHDGHRFGVLVVCRRSVSSTLLWFAQQNVMLCKT